MYNAGIRFVRMDMNWSTVEWTKGSYDFTRFDPLVNSASQYGIKVLFIFDYYNPLYDNGYSPYDATGRAAFVNYARAAIAHYQGKGLIYEVYNEPNNGNWTEPTTLTAAKIATDYTALAIAVGQAVKASYPNELLLAPALANFDSTAGQGWTDAQNLVITMMQSGAATYYDGISVHPYRWGGGIPETETADYGTLNGIIHNLSDNNTGKYPPPVSSESGYSTTWFGGNNVTPAKYTARQLLLNLMTWVPVSIVYDWMDDGTDSTNIEDNFGLVGWYDRTLPKPTVTLLPGYYAMQTLSSKLGGYSYASRINTGDGTDYVLSFTNGTKTRYVAWNKNGTQHIVNIPIPASTLLTVTTFNNDWTGTFTSGPGGGFGLQTSDGPQYIVASGQ